MAGALTAMGGVGPTSRMRRKERIPAPSAGSTTEGLREATHPEDSRALGASTEVVEASTPEVEGAFTAEVAEAGTEGAAIDSSYEAIQP